MTVIDSMSYETKSQSNSVRHSYLLLPSAQDAKKPWVSCPAGAANLASVIAFSLPETWTVQLKVKAKKNQKKLTNHGCKLYTDFCEIHLQNESEIIGSGTSFWSDPSSNK